MYDEEAGSQLSARECVRKISGLDPMMTMRQNDVIMRVAQEQPASPICATLYRNGGGREVKPARAP